MGLPQAALVEQGVDLRVAAAEAAARTDGGERQVVRLLQMMEVAHTGRVAPVAGRIAREATDAELLRVARGAALAGGLAGMALAILIPTVVLALTVFYGLLTVMFFVPVVAALLTRRVGAPEALAGMAAQPGVGLGLERHQDRHR